jgi:uncharacterized protein (TIGR00251 family)
VPAAASKIPLRLTPRGGADRIEGWRDGMLRVRVSAPAVDRRANQALLRLIARALGVPAGDVRIVRGEKSRVKLLQVDGMSQEDAEQRLGRAGLGEL